MLLLPINDDEIAAAAASAVAAAAAALASVVVVVVSRRLFRRDNSVCNKFNGTRVEYDCSATINRCDIFLIDVFISIVVAAAVDVGPVVASAGGCDGGDPGCDVNVDAAVKDDEEIK